MRTFRAENDQKATKFEPIKGGNGLKHQSRGTLPLRKRQKKPRHSNAAPIIDVLQRVDRFFDQRHRV